MLEESNVGGLIKNVYLPYFQRFIGDNPDHESVQNQKLYYHLVGTDQSKDVLVAEFPKNPDYFMYVILYLYRT